MRGPLIGGPKDPHDYRDCRCIVFQKRLRKGYRTVIGRTKGYETVTESLSRFASGARRLKEYGLDPLFRRSARRPPRSRTTITITVTITTTIVILLLLLLLLL